MWYCKDCHAMWQDEALIDCPECGSAEVGSCA
jgi:hypothetical protein